MRGGCFGMGEGLGLGQRCRLSQWHWCPKGQVWGSVLQREVAR